MSHDPYVSVVGSLMHAMVYISPDINYTIIILSIYMLKLGKEH